MSHVVPIHVRLNVAMLCTQMGSAVRAVAVVDAKGGTHNCQLAGEATVGKMKNALEVMAIV
jgi:hypothetical protein